MRLPAHLKKAKGLLERFLAASATAVLSTKAKSLTPTAPIPKFGPAPEGYDEVYNQCCRECRCTPACVENLSWDPKHKLMVSYCGNCSSTFFFVPIEDEA